MKWKLFITACVSAMAAIFPENGITCGASEDPHDYFTSFFSNKTGTDAAYKPFYYTSLLKFYDDVDAWYNEPDSLSFVNNELAEEWKVYGKGATLTDAIQLVYFTKPESLKALAESLQTGKALPASIHKNSLAASFVRDKKVEAVQYLAFTQKTAPVSNVSAWEEGSKDSLLINRYIAEATNAYSKTTDPFIKNKYAFQRCKLAFYNNRYADCIRWYDEHFTESNTSAVNQLALSYKAGSFFRTGKPDGAAYLYSKAFTLSDYNKKGNYTGFLWASDFCNQGLLPAYTALCKNNAEKAVLTAMFGMYGSNYRLDVLQKVHALDPASPLLPLLAAREVNKLEEQ